jgi:hypothetical protein
VRRGRGEEEEEELLQFLNYCWYQMHSLLSIACTVVYFSFINRIQSAALENPKEGDNVLELGVDVGTDLILKCISKKRGEKMWIGFK